VNKLQGDASKVWKRNVQLLQEIDDTIGADMFKKYVTTNIQQKSDETSKTDMIQIEQRIKKNSYAKQSQFFFYY